VGILSLPDRLDPGPAEERPVVAQLLVQPLAGEGQEGRQQQLQVVDAA
jgi:hypothetical protein